MKWLWNDYHCITQTGILPTISSFTPVKFQNFTWQYATSRSSSWVAGEGGPGPWRRASTSARRSSKAFSGLGSAVGPRRYSKATLSETTKPSQATWSDAIPGACAGQRQRSTPGCTKHASTGCESNSTEYDCGPPLVQGPAISTCVIRKSCQWNFQLQAFSFK